MSYRPYPAPASPWMMRQTWSKLLFAHWPLPPEVVQPFLPHGLPLDTYDGHAWLSIVPFRMSDVAPRTIPAVPWLSAFPELNVRTYVTLGGRPGVWFFSLDAANPVAVQIARSVFLLPYFNARMGTGSGQRAAGNHDAGHGPHAKDSEEGVRSSNWGAGEEADGIDGEWGEGGVEEGTNERPLGTPKSLAGDNPSFLTPHSSLLVTYSSVRTHRGARPAVFRARYGPTGPVALAEPGSLAGWLTARYCLYTSNRRGDILRAEINHLPWPLQPAWAEITANTMASAAGITLPDLPPLLQYVDSIDVRVWPVRRLRPGG